MFVVRLTFPDRTPDLKAFESLASAKLRFLAAEPHMPNDITSALVFQVDETTPSTAVEAVKSGHATVIQRDHWAERAADEVVDERTKRRPDA
jgi:hypothetical protein